MSDNNFDYKSITSIEDAELISPWGGPSVQIVMGHMVFDPGHDQHHLTRVMRNALIFSEGKGDPDVIVPAALLHDLVNVPKNSPDRSKASLLSADMAIDLLEDILPFKNDMHHVRIHHAIEAHSFSANVECQSWEAMCVQDADRIDSLGYLGLARLFTVNGSMGRAIVNYDDPYVDHRSLDEQSYGIDHYYLKLKTLHETMQTPLGKKMAKDRTAIMDTFIEGLVNEIRVKDNNSNPVVVESDIESTELQSVFKKKYLVLSGETHYPRNGIEDIVGAFDTLEETKSLVDQCLSGGHLPWVQILNTESSRYVELDAEGRGTHRKTESSLYKFVEFKNRIETEFISEIAQDSDWSSLLS